MAKAKPKQITKERYWQEYTKLTNKARRLANQYPGFGSWQWNFFMSNANAPCNLRNNWAFTSLSFIYGIWHFTTVPCTEYCKDKLPQSICLATAEDAEGNEKYWICKHKVGNCPWKTKIEPLTEEE